VVVFVVLEPVLVCVFGVVAVLGVLADVDVLAVVGGVVAPAGVVLLVACFEPPQPAIASAAINTPES
jgi:hypothetical protein